MTREEQIRSAAFDASTKNDDYKKYAKDGIARMFFVEGAMFADANQPSPWISVEDELPSRKSEDHPYSERVFVRYIERLDDQEHVRHCFDELLCIGKIRKWRRHQNDNERVTHWMPIPELPKEEKK